MEPHTGFLSSNEPVPHFGLGAGGARRCARGPVAGRGGVQSLENAKADQVLTVAETGGRETGEPPAKAALRSSWPSATKAV